MKVSNSSAPEPQAAIFPIVLMNGLFSAIGVGIGSPKDQDKAMFNKCGSLCEPGTDRVARRPPSTDTEAGRSHSGVLLCGAFPRDVIARWGQLLSSRGIDVAGVAYMVNYDVRRKPRILCIAWGERAGQQAMEWCQPLPLQTRRTLSRRSNARWPFIPGNIV